MYRRELFVLGSAVGVLFLLVAGITAFITWTLQSETHLVVVDTLPGLINSGKAISRMDSNWEKISVLDELPPAQQPDLIRRIQNDGAQEFWTRYEASIFVTEDQTNYLAMQSSRSNFLALAGQYVVLEASHSATAKVFFSSQLTPAFRDYRNHAMTIFNFNEREADGRSKQINRLSRLLPAIAGAFSIVIFGFGFCIGLRGALIGLEWVFRKR